MLLTIASTFFNMMNLFSSVIYFSVRWNSLFLLHRVDVPGLPACSVETPPPPFAFHFLRNKCWEYFRRSIGVISVMGFVRYAWSSSFVDFLRLLHYRALTLHSSLSPPVSILWPHHPSFSILLFMSHLASYPWPRPSQTVTAGADPDCLYHSQRYLQWTRTISSTHLDSFGSWKDCREGPSAWSNPKGSTHYRLLP